MKAASLAKTGALRGAPSRVVTDAQRQRRLLLVFFLLPGMAYLVLVRILPVFFTAYMSLTDWNLASATPPRFVGLANYGDILTDGSFLEALGRTLLFTVVVTTIELVLGVAIALMLRRDFAGRGFFRAILLTPMILTPAVIGMIWYIMFHNSIGPLNWLLGLVGVGPVDWLTDPDLALISVMITDVWHWTPFMFLLAYSAMQVIPNELYESAQVDGATPWQTTSLITIPLIKQTLLVAIILRSMDAFDVFAEPYVMTGGGPGNATEMLSIHIYRQAFGFFNVGYAGAMVVVSLAILVSIYAVYLRMAKVD